MKPVNRYIRRRNTTQNAVAAPKENQQEGAFFGGAVQETFFQPAPAIQRKCADCEKEEKVQRVVDNKEEKKVMKKEEEKLDRSAGKMEEEKLQKKDAAGASTGAVNVSSYVNSLNGKGNPLPARSNQFFSARMGYDLSNVKVHTDKEAANSAKAVNAKAYTVGNNIVFNEGQYNEGSTEGKKLMAHELAHVVQNNKNKTRIDRDVDAGVPPPAARPAKSALAEELEIIWYDKGKSSFFQRLRNITPEEYNDPDTFVFILDHLTGDEQWWATNLLTWGTESNWDIQLKLELEFKKLPAARGNAGVFSLLKAASSSEKLTVVRLMLPVLKTLMGQADFGRMLNDLKIVNMIETVSAGERELILTNTHLMQFLKNELPADDYKILDAALVRLMWTKLVGQGFDAKDENVKENKFIEALKLIGYDNVNIARGGRANPAKMKAGLNLDIYYHTHAAESGYLRNNIFNAEFPFDTEPEFAEIVGEDAFRRDSPIRTIMTLEHELEHTRHHKRILETYKKWEAKGNTKAFKDKLKKDTDTAEQMGQRRNDPRDMIDKNIKQLKADGINQWLEKQKGISDADKGLFKEATSTYIGEHPRTEVFAGLSGFMQGFHLITVKDLDAGVTYFDELTYNPVQKGFWGSIDKGSKKEYTGLLTGYYCSLSAEHQAAFDNAVVKSSATAGASSKDYYKLLANIKCN